MKKFLFLLMTLIMSSAMWSIPSTAATTGDVVKPLQKAVYYFEVTDNQGEPIIGAAIFVQGTTQGATTDIDGMAVLLCEPGSIVVVSYIGYQSQRIKLGNATNIKVVLQDEIIP